MTLKGRGGEAQYHTHMHVVSTHTKQTKMQNNYKKNSYYTSLNPIQFINEI